MTKQNTQVKVLSGLTAIMHEINEVYGKDIDIANSPVHGLVASMMYKGELFALGSLHNTQGILEAMNTILEEQIISVTDSYSVGNVYTVTFNLPKPKPEPKVEPKVAPKKARPKSALADETSED